ncbi:MAG TPA: TRAM domain-containing protein [Nocardioidaceae bacterium]|nr:TRAM domain-containing protein [Nocardioidaceae bacterium]
MGAEDTPSLVGERYTLTVERLAHGGHCVARHEGRVVFVRHTLPGERVLAEVTEGDETARFLRADAVEVLESSPDRVPPRCPVARPGGCGGCDFQHVALPAQRRLLAGVVREQLRRLAGVDVDVEVEPVAGGHDGLGWRTRVRYATDGRGRLGLRKHRSHEVVPLDHCPIAHPDLPEVLDPRWPGAASVEAVVSGEGERLVAVEPRGAGDVRPPGVEAEGMVTTSGDQLRGRTYVTEPAAGRRWRVSAGGFWQVHPGAADTLVDAALQMLNPRPGETALDLYSGVGLFAGALAARVGPDGSVLAVEGDARAAKDARRNLHDLPQVRLVHAGVGRALAESPVDRVDVVLLDPPRSGARRPVVERVVSLQPRAVCYVACDPAALARDVATFGDLGYEVASLRAFDIFPMTHHVECVVLLTPRNARVGTRVAD